MKKQRETERRRRRNHERAKSLRKKKAKQRRRWKGAEEKGERRGKEKARREKSLGPLERIPIATYSPHTESRAVPSALEVLTTEFGMGSGVDLRHQSHQENKKQLAVVLKSQTMGSMQRTLVFVAGKKKRWSSRTAD